MRLMVVAAIVLAAWAAFVPARSSSLDGERITIHEIPDLTPDIEEAEPLAEQPEAFDPAATPVLAAPGIADDSTDDAAHVRGVSATEPASELPRFAEVPRGYEPNHRRFVQTADFEATASRPPRGPAWLTGTIEIIGDHYRPEITPARR